MSIYERFSEQELAIIRARTERAATDSQVTEAGEQLSVLQVMLGSEQYALPVDHLRAVYENVTIVPIPCTPDFVAGMANVRGRVMPVLNMRVLLDTPSSNTGNSGAVIVLSTEHLTIGLQIDETGEMLTVPHEQIQPVPANSDISRTHYLQGLLTGGEILLDIDAILSDPALIVEDTPDQ